MRARLLVIPILLMPVLAACGSESDDSPAASTTATAAAGACIYKMDGPAAKPAELPPADPEAADSLTVSTNRGDIGLTLTPKTAPCTVNSFVSLAKQGYFNDTKCHRLVVGFVLQCGDPSATGTGGPGYSFKDELSGDESYPAGTLAMANAGPDTNGSQFFIVLQDSQLPPDYTVFGSVDAAGLKVARAIEKKGNAADGVAPAEDVVIKKVA